MIEAPDVATLLRRADERRPGLRSYLVDDDRSLRKHVNIFVNNELLEDRESLRDRVLPGDRVFIMQALSGG